jgi:hypothetical protein
MSTNSPKFTKRASQIGGVDLPTGRRSDTVIVQTELIQHILEHLIIDLEGINSLNTQPKTMNAPLVQRAPAQYPRCNVFVAELSAHL